MAPVNLSHVRQPVNCSVDVQVLKETKQLCSSAVEPLVNSVDSVKQYGVDKVGACCSCVIITCHILTTVLQLTDHLHQSPSAE